MRNQALFRAQGLWSAGVILVWVALLLSFPIDPDYTSGELLDHFYSWTQGADLYPALDAPPFRVLNYPPLYFYLVRGVAFLGLSPLSAGRAVNLSAFFITAWVLFRWLRKETVGGTAGWRALTLIGAGFPILYSLGQMHLQMTAVAFSLGGLYLLQFGKKSAAICMSACLLAAAVFVKQTQWVSACVALCWLFTYRRGLFFPFLLSFLIASSGGAFLLQHLHGGEIWRHLLTYTFGTYSFRNLFLEGAKYVLSWFFLFLLGVYFFRRFKEKRSRLSGWYFLASTLWLVSAARDGASFQYFLEWSFALLLWTGPWLAGGWREALPGLGLRRWAPVFLILQVALADLGVAGVLAYNVRELQRTTSLLPQICRGLGPSQTVVPGEFPGLVRACGQTPAIHPFIMSSLARQNIWDEKPFLDRLSDGTYPVLLMTPDETRWTPRMAGVIKTHYEETASFGPWHILNHRNIRTALPGGER